MTQQAVTDATAAQATSAAHEPAGRHPTAGETAVGARRAVVLSCSTDGLTGTPNAAHHTAASHGAAGLMRALALDPARIPSG